MKTFQMKATQKVGYEALKQRILIAQQNLRDYFLMVISENGGDPSLPWEFDPEALTFTVKAQESVVVPFPTGAEKADLKALATPEQESSQSPQTP